MTDKKRIQNPPTIAMRLNDADKNALRHLSRELNTSQTATVRTLIREANFILPELKKQTAKVKR